MLPEDDYMQSLIDTTTRFRSAEEAIVKQKPQPVMRPAATPSGTSQRNNNTRNAYARIQSKKLGR